MIKLGERETRMADRVDLGHVSVGSGGKVKASWDPGSKKVFVGTWTAQQKADKADQALRIAEALAASK